MKLVLGAIVASLLSAFAASAQSVDAERLQAMRQAAAGLEDLASRRDNAGQRVLPSSPEVAEFLAVVCNAKEAESLGHPRLDQFDDVYRYALHVYAALAVFTKRDSVPLADILVPELEPCIDADLWASRASMSLVKLSFAERPALAQNTKAMDSRQKMALNTVSSMHAVLMSFRLRSLVRPSWCDARIRPLLALAETAAEEMSRDQRESLQADVRAAETCSPAAKPGLQAIYDKLAP